MTTKKTYNFRGADYRCHGPCGGATKRKLWREYNTFLDHNELLCASCIAPLHDAYDKKRDPRIRAMTDGDDATLTKDGHFVFGGRGDQLVGSRVPAIPTREGDTFWGYSSCRSEDIRWWYRLPTHTDPVLDAIAVENLILRHFEYARHARDTIVSLRAKCAELAVKLGFDPPALDVPLFRDTPDPADRYDVLDALLEAEHAREQCIMGLYDTLNDLRWKLERAIYYVVKPCEISVWTRKTTPVAKGGGAKPSTAKLARPWRRHRRRYERTNGHPPSSLVLSFSEEARRTLEVGDKLAVVVRNGDDDWWVHYLSWRDPDHRDYAWSITDEGSVVIGRLAREGAISPHPPR